MPAMDGTESSAVRALLPDAREQLLAPRWGSGPECGVSLTEKVYRHVVNGIRSGQFSPSERLTQRQIAVELEVSQVTVRAAFERLAQHGLVDQNPRRGVTIRSFSDQDRDEIYWIREMLEASAVRQVAEKITDKQLAELKSGLNVLVAACQNGDVEHYEDADAKFHTLIVGFAGNRMLDSYYESIIRQIRSFLMVGAMIKVEFHWVERCEFLEPVSHEKIFEAIAARNPDLAEKLVRKHISFGNEVIQMVNRAREP